MLLRLLQLICMFAATAAQRTYYCNSFAGVIRDSDFYLVTRNQTDTSYSPGFSCEFNAESSSVAFLVEIEAFVFSTAVLTVNSKGNTLFRGSQLTGVYQKAIATPSSNLQVLFNAGKYFYSSYGVRLRVRAFNRNGCPPDWQYLYGNCYGTSNATGSLNYTDAQKTCNSMRSNLLLLPSNYAGSLTSFRNLLPSYLKKSNPWIGLTDRSSQYRHTWLNGVRQISTDEILCLSGGRSSNCPSFARCGFFFGTGSAYAIYMDSCSQFHNYACSMPPGGTGNFYSVPNPTNPGGIQTNPPREIVYSRHTYMNLYLISMGGVIILGAVCYGCFCGDTKVRKTAGASSVVVSAGSVMVPLSPPGFQVQKFAAVSPPPAYDVAVGDGYPGNVNVNMGYAKYM